MYLNKINYKESVNSRIDWNLNEFTLKDINLIVGKNASGKTRMLNVISSIAQIISGRPLPTGNFEVSFKFYEENNIEYIFKFKCINGKVAEEQFIKNNTTLLTRDNEGKGDVFYEEQNEKIKFQVPKNILASTLKKDIIQQPYLIDLFHWADMLIHYHFATQSAQNVFFIDSPEKPAANLNFKDENSVVAIFNAAVKENKNFSELIIQDMNKIGYHIKSITLSPVDINIMGGLPPTIKGEILAFNINEQGLYKQISQGEISQGMFRALVLIVNINYLLTKEGQYCILIDDIGEGLDFERASALIKLLIDKLSGSSVQLIMTTNDRFIMNSVPLKYWSIIDRRGADIKVFNYENTKEIFEEFAFTGLSNFDFFSTEFYEKGFGEEK